MRILSWNINGVRTLPQYHPWNTFKSFQDILLHLKADIICFQEMKTSRSGLDRNIAVPDLFDAFFSFPTNKGGYSGVAVYTDTRTVTPLKAEEGLSGTLQPRPPLALDERISRSYPHAPEMEMMPDELANTPSDLISLDAEGRALVLDFSLFVLINVYCPNETSDARLSFKMNYHFMLQERVNKLINEGREVIVVGDVNICATPLDHCDGHLASNAATFHDHPARAWFRNWLTPNGCMTDAVRTFWPGRKGMYTCWNTKISARETNYGTRVDYILVTPGMLPWIKHGDIHPSLKGSDHCPIFIDLHDEIVTSTGKTLTLREAMPVDGKKIEPPRLAARRWEEFSGKQTLLSSFFAKGGMVTVPGNDSQPLASPRLSPPQAPAVSSALLSRIPDVILTDPAQDTDLPDASEPCPFLTTSNSKSSASSDRIDQEQKPIMRPSVARKRKAAADPPLAVMSKANKIQKKGFAGQSTLAAFFAQAPSQSQTSDVADDPPTSEVDPSDCLQVNADYQLALRLSASQDLDTLSQSSLSSTPTPSSGSKAAWSQLMAPVQPPQCVVHGEATKEYTVNKPGPNKGKTFFICSRPVGPGYDKGKGERLREEVDHKYRCNFFKWSAEARREALQAGAKPPPKRQ
ncbi:Endonuclease/exonuclease/phosphatase [Melanogaster broomeanus]|nr:Endonuclease/exonuclease/phosphatase [Melanogaster broomeanus]